LSLRMVFIADFADYADDADFFFFYLSFTRSCSSGFLNG